jgi:hypothetical protein
MIHATTLSLSLSLIKRRAYKHVIIHHDTGESFSGDYFFDFVFDYQLYAFGYLHNKVYISSLCVCVCVFVCIYIYIEQNCCFKYNVSSFSLVGCFFTSSYLHLHLYCFFYIWKKKKKVFGITLGSPAHHLFNCAFDAGSGILCTGIIYTLLQAGAMLLPGMKSKAKAN